MIRPSIKTIFICCLCAISSIAAVNSYAKGGVGSIFGGILGQAIGKATGRALASPEEINSALIKTCNEANKELPKKIDNETRIDSLSAGNKKMTYHYTVLSGRAVDFDHFKFSEIMTTRLSTAACNSDDLKPVFRAGITVSYDYKGFDGLPIATIDVTPSQCGVKNQ